jgi:DNA-directed RNA polymerase specialized sigma24 family protein
MLMTAVEPAENYASPQQVAIALVTMSSADKARLKHSAQLRSVGLSGISWEDLVSEAAARALSGVRHWPIDVPFPAFMMQTIRSIASEEWQRLSASGELLESDLASVYDDQRDSILAELAIDTVTPERIFLARSALQEIESLFFDDPEALSVISGLALGHSPEETRTMARMTAVSYATTQRRIRRALEKHFSEKRLV